MWGKKSILISFAWLLISFFFPFKARALDISTDTTWEGNWLVDTKIEIQNGVTLTLAPGTQLRFEKDGNFRVYGNLIVNGNRENPVIFYRDKPQPEDERWPYYFLFGATSHSVISGMIIREAGGYAGGSSWMPGMRIEGSLEIYDSLITNNTWALEVRNKGSLLMRSCDIYDNHGTWGLTVVGDLATADVKENYWGDDSGPRHTSFNASGRGELILGSQLLFSPWLTKGKKPLILLPGYGESLSLELFFPDQQAGGWYLFPPNGPTAKLKEALVASGYEEGKNLFINCYDWRKPLREITPDLLKTIENAKNVSGHKAVSLIGFSFGGLVARGYLQGDAYKHEVRNFITLGTPHQGLSKIYPLVEGGILPEDYNPLLYLYLWINQLIKQQNILDYLKTGIPSLYELVPTYDFLKDQTSGILKDGREINIYNASLGDLNNGIGVLKARIRNYFIGGGEQPTIAEIPVKSVDPALFPFWLDGQPDPLFPILDSNAGDGTVLLKSSVPDTWGIETMLKNSTHANLPLEALPQIEAILEDDLAGLPQLVPLSLNYIFIIIPPSLEVTISDNSGNILSPSSNSIPDAKLYQEGTSSGKIFYAPYYQGDYRMELKARAEQDSKLYFFVERENGQKLFKELPLSLTENQTQNYLLDPLYEGEDPRWDEIEIVENITSNYPNVAKALKDFYDNKEISIWEERQLLLELLLEAYHCSRSSQEESENSLLFELKKEIENGESSGIIQQKASRVLLEAINNL